MASERHRTHLKQYFKAHKERRSPVMAEAQAQARSSPTQTKFAGSLRDDSASSGSVSPLLGKSKSPKNMIPTSTSRTTMPNISLKVSKTCRNHKIKASMDTLPDEILQVIFSLLTPNGLMLCARVCKRWLHLTNDNVIWQRVYQEYVRKSKQPGTTIPANAAAAYWKSECIRRCVELRNKSALTLMKKIHPFTGLPANTEKALQKSGVRWCIQFTDTDGQEHRVNHNEVFYFAMAASVRWYSLDMPPIGRIRKLGIYSANPVFFDSAKGAPHPNSSCQRSLLYEMDFKWQNISQTMPVVAADDAIDIHILPANVLVATWKDGGELAFIMACFHFNSLVQRCLLGDPDRPFVVPAHHPAHDDLDSKRGTSTPPPLKQSASVSHFDDSRMQTGLLGFHGYKCTVELRNQRSSFYSQQFRDLYCPVQEAGRARFHLIREDSSYQHSPVGKKISFPWKSDLFKGVVQNVCILDLTLLDESQTPMWCVSSPVKVATPSLAAVVYDYDGDHYYIDYGDTSGKMTIKLVWEAEIGQYIITSMEVQLALSFINQWFGTNY